MGMNAKPYPTDLTDAAWDLIKNLIPPPKPGGCHRELEMRAVVNAIFSIVDGGITWRMRPHEYPKWPSVYWYVSPWRDSGDWQRMHDTLRARVRQEEGRHKHPTAGCLDSQSVKTTEYWSMSAPGVAERKRNFFGRVAPVTSRINNSALSTATICGA